MALILGLSTHRAARQLLKAVRDSEHTANDGRHTTSDVVGILGSSPDGTAASTRIGAGILNCIVVRCGTTSGVL